MSNIIDDEIWMIRRRHTAAVKKILIENKCVDQNGSFLPNINDNIVYAILEKNGHTAISSFICSCCKEHNFCIDS